MEYFIIGLKIDLGAGGVCVCGSCLRLTLLLTS